jgi:hypothetical protein
MSGGNFLDRCEHCGRSGHLGIELAMYYVKNETSCLLCVTESGRPCVAEAYAGPRSTGDWSPPHGRPNEGGR